MIGAIQNAGDYVFLRSSRICRAPPRPQRPLAAPQLFSRESALPTPGTGKATRGHQVSGHACEGRKGPRPLFTRV